MLLTFSVFISSLNKGRTSLRASQALLFAHSEDWFTAMNWGSGVGVLILILLPFRRKNCSLHLQSALHLIKPFHIEFFTLRANLLIL